MSVARDLKPEYVGKMRKLMRENAWRASDLARAMDVNRSTVGDWFGTEKGITKKHRETIDRLLTNDCYGLGKVETKFLIEELKRRGAKQVVF
jgi:plasmid maintenance system antidote protein VapI